MERTIPNSLKDKYLDERTQLYNLLWKLDDAIIALSSESVASYSLGNRSVSYQNLDQIKTLRKDVEDRIEELEAYLRGASPRSVQVSSFLDPSFCIPRW